MNEEKMPAEAMPAGPQGAPAPEAGPEDVAEKLTLLSTSLSSIAEGLGQQQGVPPEALEAIQMASSAYDKFLSIVGKQMGVQAPAPKGGVNPAETGGRAAMPADMPMGNKGMKAVPA
jgi:hypothetical protein